MSKAWGYGRCGPNCFHPDCDCTPDHFPVDRCDPSPRVMPDVAKKPSGCEPCSWPECGCQYSPTPAVITTVAQGCVESRENIAKVIAYDLENGPAHGARVATTPHLDNYYINGHVNLLALADAVIAAQPPAAPVETKSASEMIAACYEGLCPDGSSALDFEWARQRGYILPNNGSGKLSPAQCSADSDLEERVVEAITEWIGETPPEHAIAAAREAIAVVRTVPQSVAWPTIALGDMVYMNERSPYFHDWKGTSLKVVSLRIEPDGKLWASVIEGERHHRGNGSYDAETTDIDAEHLSPLSRPHGESSASSPAGSAPAQRLPE
jgi:hypothetical protein